MPVPKNDPVLKLDSLRARGFNEFQVYGTLQVPSWLTDAKYGIVYTNDSIPRFETSRVIEIGAANGEVRLDKLLNQLPEDKNIYFRAYVRNGQQIWYSVEMMASTERIKIVGTNDMIVSRNQFMIVQTNLELANKPGPQIELYLGEQKMVIDAHFGNIIHTKAPALPPGTYRLKIKKGNYLAESAFKVKMLSGYWKDLPEPPFAPRARAGYFIIGNTAYIVGGTLAPFTAESAINEVWAFDMQARTWSRKANYPEVGIYSPYSFATNGKGYVMGGTNYISGSGTGSVYEYNPGNDSWTNIGYYSEMAKVKGMFTAYDNKIWFGCGDQGQHGGSYNDWYCYDPVRRELKTLARIPDPSIKNSTAFALNGKIYVLGGMLNFDELFEYDITANSWKHITTNPVLGFRHGIASAVSKGKAYVFGGAVHTLVAGGYEWVQQPDCYQFDPIAKNWIQVASYNGAGRPGTAPTVFPTANGFILYGGVALGWELAVPAFAEFVAE